MSTTLPAEIRTSIRKKRKALSKSQQIEHAARAHQHLKNWINQHLPDASKIALFLSQDGELDTQQTIQYIWQETQHQVYLPVLDTHPDVHMAFCHYHANSEMKKNQFGILEPAKPFAEHIDGQQLDLVIMPLVAFDKFGHRLGMGGGFYDRTFAFMNKANAKHPYLMGWTHQCQEYNELPTEPWDIPLNGVITENGFIAF